jgi:hypothetical protein
MPGAFMVCAGAMPVTRIVKSPHPLWERIGNAYRLELTGKGALIEDLVDEDGPAQKITLEDFSKAVEAWIEAFE